MITKYGFKPNDSLLIDFYRLNQLAESKNTVKERFFKEKFFDISNDKINLNYSRYNILVNYRAINL